MRPIRLDDSLTDSSANHRHNKVLVMSSARKPEKVFRIGFVSASVFLHDIQGDDGKRSVRSVHLQRRYMDGNEAKYTSYFNLAELPQALRVLQIATNYVESCEATVLDTDRTGGNSC